MRKTPIVLGISSILFGSIVTINNAVVFITLSITASIQRSGAKISESILGSTSQEVYNGLVLLQNNLKAYDLVLWSSKVAMSVLLVVAGLGMVMRSSWARKLTIAWGIAALAYVALTIVLHFVILEPASVESNIFNNSFSFLNAASSIAGIILDLPFPIILLIFIGRKSAVDDFKKQEVKPAPSQQI